MAKKAGFNIPGEKTYYHVYNFGVDRRVIFNTKEDYDRFEAYLYLLNAVESQRAANFFAPNRKTDIFKSARGERLVAIGAYSFSSHDFHILVVPLVEGGIAKFMQKLQTAYTMYFNRKYPRVGSLFQSPYKMDVLTKHDEIKHLFSFIHMNPIENMHKESVSEVSRTKLITLAKQYRYSSMNEYDTGTFSIVDPKAFPKVFRTANDPLSLATWLNSGSRR